MLSLRASHAFLAAALLGQASAAASPPASIDRIFTTSGDVTGEGQPDLLSVRVTGTSIDAPFSWTAAITDKTGRVIFQTSGSGASFDKFFRDPGFERGCSGYVRCKERYYFHDVPAEFFAAISPAPAAWSMDRYFAADLTDTVSAYLQRQDVAPKKIPAIIEEIKTTLSKPGYHVLYLLTSPVEQTPPMIWVPAVQKFIPFYQE